MRTLRIGMSGADVRAWEHFLVGRLPTAGVVADGFFDETTRQATCAFQSGPAGFQGRDVDGIVGPQTLARALQLGFDPLHDDAMHREGPNWPPAPARRPLHPLDRARLFGTFSFVPAPSQQNPEAIRLTDGWADKNIVTVEVPQLVGLARGVKVHRLVASQLQRLFSSWEQAGLRNRLASWGGCWVPRFVRGSRSSLSNHSWGTAFDINVSWNLLGSRPALLGQPGCVRELVETAYQHGFYWGGWFRGRPDGMHFEAYDVVG